jgi:uncharacterized protein (TIGR01244 family)
MLEEIHNYRAVDERLATSGQPSEEQLAEIAGAGFETVVNLALHDDPRYSLPDEAGTVEGLGMEYVHIPVDFGAPTAGDLEAFFVAYEAHRDGKVLVHCAANWRVSAFVGLYRTLREGVPREEAFAQLYELWQPNEVWADFVERMLAAGDAQ